MATVKNRPAIDYGAASMIYIPPFSFRLRRNSQQTTVKHKYVLLPQEPLKRTTNAPAFGSATGLIQENDYATALGRFDDMELALRGGTDGYFDLYYDSFRYFKQCSLPNGGGIRADYGQSWKGIIPFSFDWQSRWPNDFTAVTEVPAGPFENFITNGEAGSYVVASVQKTSYQFDFVGELQVTGAGFDFVFEPEGEVGDTLEIVSIQGANQAYYGTAGNSTVRVCDIAKGGVTTNSILLTQAWNSLHARNTGSFTITVGDKLYLYCETANGHLDLAVTVIVEG